MARAGLMRLFCRFESITTVFADGGYPGKRIDWAKDRFGYSVEIVKCNEQHRFQLLPRRWIVERTFAWLNWSRRLGKMEDRAQLFEEKRSAIEDMTSSAVRIVLDGRLS
jgi:transposase